MASKIRLIRPEQLKKSSRLVRQQAAELVQASKQAVSRQAAFMQEIGIEKKDLRRWMNSELWPARLKQKAHEELIRFNQNFKRDLAQDLAAFRKQQKAATRLFVSKMRRRRSGIKRRTGFL